MEKHVFISYFRENQQHVDRLCADLEEQGVKVWLDRHAILPGMRWQNAIKKAITDGSFFLACFSDEYFGRSRSYMNEELELAIDELRQRPRDRAFFIPIKLTPTEIPDYPISARENIRSLQWVDLWEDWDKGMERILAVLKTVEKLPYESLPELFQAVKEAEAELKKEYPGVNSIAIDRVTVQGQLTTEWCIRVYGQEKLPLHKVEKPLPYQILGFPVDVAQGR